MAAIALFLSFFGERIGVKERLTTSRYCTRRYKLYNIVTWIATFINYTVLLATFSYY